MTPLSPSPSRWRSVGARCAATKANGLACEGWATSTGRCAVHSGFRPRGGVSRERLRIKWRKAYLRARERA